jgi:regulatory protein YycH of two-component signal transduction system YycFG
MSRVRSERFKSYILALLIVSSIIQVGILWEYQNHGFPINFLMPIFAGSSSNTSNISEVSRQEYFVPFRIIVSNGNESHWLISRSNNFYNKLFESAKNILGQVLGSKQSQNVQFQSAPADIWGDIVTKKGVVFEFKSGINLNLVKWFLELPAVSTENPSEIHKLMVVPGFGGSTNVYILGKDMVYSYNIPFKAEKSEENIFDKVLAEVEKNKSSSMESFNVAREMYGESSKLSIMDPDILCVIAGSKFRSYRDVTVTIPGRISDLEYMANVIFPRNEIDSYDRYVDVNETLIFKNLDNIYRVYNQGFLEYKYLPGYEGTSGKGTISSAFVKAAAFIERVKKQADLNANVFISRVKENPGSYEFVFDYIVEDIPVYLNLNTAGRSRQPMRNAIVIEANGKRILSLRWMLRNFEITGEKKRYIVGLEDILNASNLDRTGVYIEDMGAAYVIEDNVEKRLEPVWVIEIKDGENCFVKLQKDLGE